MICYLIHTSRPLDHSIYRSSLTDFDSKTITAGKNFYDNGVNLEPAGDWTLSLKSNDDATVSSLVEVAVMSLAGTYYQNRLAISSTSNYVVDLTVNSIIGQLRGLRDSFAEKEDKDGV